ncbi:MAG: glycosyltransferase family 39 protein [Chloroflexota bacterium]|nr:glycosyltransferase family 39 protein [Chloroflexota bacterium]
MARSDRRGAGMLVVGLALAAVGQFYFMHRREYPWDGAVLWAGSILFLALALRRVQRMERGRAGGARGARWWWPSALQAHPIRTFVAIGGLWLSFAVGLWARRRTASGGFGDLLVLWILGIVAFLAAFVPSAPTPAELWRRIVNRGGVGRWLSRNRLELAGLSLLLLLALAVRAYNLEYIPANLGGDEGSQGADALELVEAPLGNPFSTGWFSVPTMSFLAYGLSMRIFGATVGGLRALSAVIGTATVLTTFLLARELWGDRAAWFSAVMLASSHYHVHFSRLGSNQVADGFFVTLTLWLLVRGLQTRRPVAFAAAGAAAGLGWYGYSGARLVGVVAACYAGLQALWRHRFVARYGHLLVIMLAAALLVLTPLLLHYVAHPAELVSRPRQVSIFASGWLQREQQMTGRSAASLLLQQLWRSISAFNYTLDPTFWYRPSIPLLDSVSGALFIVGLVWTIGHYRWPSNSLLLTWFWLALIAGWVMTENPPSSQRLVGAAPALAMLVALGLDWILGLGRGILNAPRAVRHGVVGLVLSAVVGLNLGYYFLVYTPTRVYGNPTAEMATHLSRYLASQEEDHTVYLHGPPSVYWGFGTFRFMARDITGVDVPPPDEGEPPEMEPHRGARFVFHPARVDELESVRRRAPGGDTLYVPASGPDELLYAVYEVSP